MKTAIILGATGLTGGVLLQKLLHDNRYNKVKLFSRKSVGISHPKIEEYLIDMLQLNNHSKNFTADEVFCCVGTTNAKTSNKELYHKIDFGIPVHTAQLCLENNISTLLIISALGANAKSSVFYNCTKGKMEESVLAFKIPKIHILQPSLIGGKRNEKRPGEYFLKQVMKIFNPLLIGAMKKYRTIEPKTIVSAMIWLANHEFDQVRIGSDEVNTIAKKLNDS